MSKLSKSARSLKSVVNNRDSSSPEDEDIHLKDLSPEPLDLEAEPASQQKASIGQIVAAEKKHLQDLANCCKIKSSF
jgi:hypothetical protein